MYRASSQGRLAQVQSAESISPGPTSPGRPSKSPRPVVSGLSFGNAGTVVVLCLFIYAPISIYHQRELDNCIVQLQFNAHSFVPKHDHMSPTFPPAPPIPSRSFEEEVELQYQRFVKRRDAALETLVTAGQLNPWDHDRGVYVWDYFTPAYNCPTKERVGHLGDGGKWMCDVDGRRDEGGCTILSFGARDDVSFELDLVKRTGCHADIFDPTVGNLPLTMRHPRIRFHKKALSAISGLSPFLLSGNLRDIMTHLNISFIDVLKVDIEGSEWEVFDSLLQQQFDHLPVGQILIELHLPQSAQPGGNMSNVSGAVGGSIGSGGANASNMSSVHAYHHDTIPLLVQFFSRLERIGFRIFSNEVNFAPIFDGMDPIAIEYSLIHPRQWVTRLATSSSRSHHVAAPQPAANPSTGFSPEPLQVSGCIFFLTHTGRVSSIERALTELNTNVTSRFPYPVVVFHTDLASEVQERLQSAVPNQQLRFEHVQLKGSGTGGPSKERPQGGRCDLSEWEGSASRFMALEVHERLTALGYDYHWRLSDIARFPEPVPYDVFQVLRDTGRVYGTTGRVTDDPVCVRGLWSVTDEYIQTSGITPTFYTQWIEGMTFYGGFEISHRSLWQTEKYRSFIHLVDTSDGGFLGNRWGDAAAKTLWLSLFTDVKDIHMFDDLGFEAAPCVNRTLPSGLPAKSAKWFQDGVNDYSKWYNLTTLFGCGYSDRVEDHRPTAPKGQSKPLQAEQGSFKFGMLEYCAPPPLPSATVKRCSKGLEFQANATGVIKSGGNQVRFESKPARALQGLLSPRMYGYMGADVGASLALPGGKKYLWLLGDTLHGTYEEATCHRKATLMPRNTIAIFDTSTISHESTEEQMGGLEGCFYYRLNRHGSSTSLFQQRMELDNPRMWLWVYSGASIGNQTFLISSAYSLGLRSYWDNQGDMMIVIRNPLEDPGRWDYELRPMRSPFPEVHWFTAIITDPKNSSCVYIVGNKELLRSSRDFKSVGAGGAELEKTDFTHNTHPIVVSRIHANNLVAQQWDRQEFLVNSPRGAEWTTSPKSAGALKELFTSWSGQESGFQYHEGLQLWLALSLNHMHRHNVYLHHAPRLEGPWDNVTLAEMQPPFDDIKNWLCYAPKWHVEFQRTSQELIFTVICTEIPWMWADNPSVYVPLFMNVSLDGSMLQKLKNTPL